MDSGKLYLYALHNTGPWGLLKFALRALLSRAWRIKDFDALAAREIMVELRRERVRVALDGEITELETPLRYRIRSGALRVIVPAAEPGYRNNMRALVHLSDLHFGSVRTALIEPLIETVRRSSPA